MSLKVELDSNKLASWRDSLLPSTRRVYGFYFSKYMDWLRGEGMYLTPENLLRDYEGLKSREQYRHVDVLKRWVKQVGGSRNARNSAYSSVRSFYEFNRLNLPPLSRRDRREMFRVTEQDVQHHMADKPITREQLRTLLLETSQPYRSILLIMFQGGLGQAEFQYFNRHTWHDVVDNLKSIGPVQVNIYRKKISTEDVHDYYTFLSSDSKDAIERWLPQRDRMIKRLKVVKPGAEKCLFLAYDRTNRCIVAPQPQSMWKAMWYASLRLKMRRAGEFSKYKPHKLRHAFRSICTVCGVSKIASEWFLGHKIDYYDKSPDLDVEFFRKEYEKAEPQINLFSNPGDQMKVRQMEEQYRSLESKVAELTRLIKK